MSPDRRRSKYFQLIPTDNLRSLPTFTIELFSYLQYHAPKSLLIYSLEAKSFKEFLCVTLFPPFSKLVSFAICDSHQHSSPDARRISCPGYITGRLSLGLPARIAAEPDFKHLDQVDNVESPMTNVISSSSHSKAKVREDWKVCWTLKHKHRAIDVLVVA